MRITNNQIKRIHIIVKELPDVTASNGVTFSHDDQYREILKRFWNAETCLTLTAQQAGELIGYLERMRPYSQQPSEQCDKICEHVIWGDQRPCIFYKKCQKIYADFVENEEREGMKES